MKKFTKLFLSCAAVAAVTAAVATSAMAAEKTLTATYNEPTDATAATTTVTIACNSTDEVQTLLILKPGADKTNIDTQKILQIDQQDAKIATATIPVLDEEKEEDKGTYTVLVGGKSGDIYMGTFTIGAEPVLVGEVDGNGRITQTDAVSILQYASGDTTAIADEYLPAAYYCDGNKRVTQTDAVNVLQYASGDKTQEYVGKSMVIPE